MCATRFLLFHGGYPTISILGDLKIILSGLVNQFSAEHGAAEAAGGRFPDFWAAQHSDMLSAILVLLALAGTFSLSLELRWTVGLELEMFFLHGMEVLGFHDGSVQLRGMGEGTT